jgi:hypothetical protein
MPYKDKEKDRACHRESKRRQYARNPDKFRSRIRRWKAANPDKQRGYKEKWRHTPSGKASEKAHSRKRERLGTLALTDRYIRRLLSKHTLVKRSAWPQTLVEAKRAELQLRRRLHEYSAETGNVG